MIARFLFALKHKTWRRIVPIGSGGPQMEAYYRGRAVKMERYCPHQGAPLEKGRIEGEYLVCPWHGCRFSLKDSSCRPFRPGIFHPR